MKAERVRICKDANMSGYIDDFSPDERVARLESIQTKGEIALEAGACKFFVSSSIQLP